MKSLASVAASAGFTSLRIDRLALLAAVSLALIVRFYAIDVPSIWYDEAYSLLLARETPTRIWTLTGLDVHPPLYYVLLHYWVMVWGDSSLSARAMSALADVGTLLLCIKLMSLITTRRATWIAALLLSLLPISVRYSQEVRMYTLLGFWLIGATVALVCWTKTPEVKRFSLIYVVLMTAAFYTHYFAGLCILVHWLFWWKSRNSVNRTIIPFARWAVANAMIVLLFLPWAPALVDQLGNLSGLGWIEPVSFQGALGLVWQFTVLDGAGGLSSWWQLLPLALTVACVVKITASDYIEKNFRWLLVSYFFFPGIALYLLALAVPLFIPRYLVFAAIGLPMIVGAAIDEWAHDQRLLSLLLLMLFVAAQLYGVGAVYRQSDQMNGTDLRRDFRIEALATSISRDVRPDDQIVIDYVLWFLPFTYYSTRDTQPKYYVGSPMSEFLKMAGRGGFRLISESSKDVYFDRVESLKCTCPRVWWISVKPLSDLKKLLGNDWTQTLTIQGGKIAAHLFEFNARPASEEVEASMRAKQKLSPPAQNCPP
ncbi:glycosyltransferase family 39 protein [Pseudomonas gozinkensis]|uniref:glycosyltransferase family 39 protein n=1 Tax=Pseudomonas gozinkensis TaxID=2774461 RepID=UPI001787E961|nr:glycosyltransferase family 39 protein [Pseudomonas gozinkensis]